MSEVNYRRNGMKYSTTGKCWGMAPKAVGFSSDLPAKGPKPKSSCERRRSGTAIRQIGEFREGQRDCVNA